jgi:hypothetical protein
MSETDSYQRLRQSAFITVSINCVMVLAGTISSMVKPLHWLWWVARAIATPPGLILRFVIRPNGSSVVSFAVAAFAGVFGSLVIYGLLAYAALWLFDRRQSAKTTSNAA